MNALEISDLRVSFGTRERRIEAVRGVSLSVAPGQVLGVVGESGSGKSTVALAAARLLPEHARIDAGSVRVDGIDLLALSERELRVRRRGGIGMVFQDPLSALNPVLTVGRHLDEALRAQGHPKRARRERAVELLDRVGIREPRSRLGDYPHQYSGGMRQRVVIALALAGDPKVLLADEPTTALDATVQAQVLDLIAQLGQDLGMAVVLVSHDIGVVRRISDEVAVMRGGEVVEQGPMTTVFDNPTHPYSKALIQAATGHGSPPAPAESESEPDHEPLPLLEAANLTKTFHTKRGEIHALQDVSLELRPGRTLAIVGESGSGKSTLVRTLLGIHQPDSGTVTLRTRTPHAAQMIFQDPYASLNPRLRVGSALAEILALRGVPRPDRAGRVDELLREVGLDPQLSTRRPRDLSGGQRQRVCIARALACEPELLVCDEPVSALDANTRAQVLTLLRRIQRERGLAMLFITHDRALADDFAHETLDLTRPR